MTIRALTLALALAAGLAPAAAAQEAAAPAAAPAPAAAAAAPDPVIEEQTRALALQLRCPVCTGVSIGESQSELSNQMKDVIRQQLVAGKSPEEVKQYFVARYGEWILLEPEAEGFNLLVYVLPALGLMAGGVVLALTMRRWMAGAPPSGLALAPEADDVAAPRP